MRLECPVPNNTMSLHFYRHGLAAVYLAREAAGVAAANPLDRFVLHVGKIVEHAIAMAVNTGAPDEVLWFDNFMATPRGPQQRSGQYELRRAPSSPFVVAIASEAFQHFHQDHSMPHPHYRARIEAKVRAEAFAKVATVALVEHRKVLSHHPDFKTANVAFCGVLDRYYEAHADKVEVPPHPYEIVALLRKVEIGAEYDGTDVARIP